MAWQLLFSYGTLQQAEVQLATFGAVLNGEPDAAVGFRLGQVVVDDPHVVRVSGLAVHPALIPDDSPEAVVGGTVFALTDDQLARADDYEVDAYQRVEVPLKSGRRAWVYWLDPTRRDIPDSPTGTQGESARPTLRP